MKIVFFDWWEKGAHHFVPLSRRLTDLGHGCVMVHYGRWYDPNVAIEDAIDGVIRREISFYGGDFAAMLETERPDAVLVLNCGATIDRVINRICRLHRVPTIYLMHGIKAIGADLDEFIRQQNNHWTLARRIAKIPKYIGLIRTYLSVIARDNPLELFLPSTYGHFLQLALQPGQVRERPWPHKDVYCDLALVYANVYRDSLVTEAHYPPGRISVVGNPNLDQAVRIRTDPALQEQALQQLKAIGVPAGRKAVLYIEDAFVEQGIGHWTEDTRTGELAQISDAVVAVGFDLIVKMHPGSNPAAVFERFGKTPGVHIVLKADLPGLVWSCAATVGHVSTALMIPIALGRPLIVPTWSPGLQRYGYYVASGVATPVSNVQQLNAFLARLDDWHNEEDPVRKRFVDDYLTYTDGQSTERIVRFTLNAAATAH